MKRLHFALAAFSMLSAMSSCRHNPNNAVGEDGILKVDWDAIHEQERQDSVSDRMCLHLYQEDPSPDSVSYFLSQGADPNHVFVLSSSRLKLGARIPVVNLLIRNKYTEYEEHLSPFRMAIAQKSLAIVDVLLKAGGDINEEVGGMRPIDEAVAAEDLKMVKALVARSADIRLANLGETYNVRLIDSLMAMGADGSTIDVDPFINDEDYKALDHLMQYKKEIREVDCFQVINFSGNRMLGYLLEHGLNPDATCTSAGGGAILLQACESGEWKAAVQLLEAGANPNTVGNFERRPIHHVASAGDSAMANLLLSKGAEVNPGPVLGDVNGPIDQAVSNDNVQMVAWLMRHDRTVNKDLVNKLLLESEAPKVKAWMKTR